MGRRSSALSLHNLSVRDWWPYFSLQQLASNPGYQRCFTRFHERWLTCSLANNRVAGTFGTQANLSGRGIFFVFLSPYSFDRYLSQTSRPPKVPWGRSLSYGGFGPVQLPKEYRPKQEPPTRVQKGHRHYGGGGMPFPR